MQARDRQAYRRGIEQASNRYIRFAGASVVIGAVACVATRGVMEGTMVK